MIPRSQEGNIIRGNLGESASRSNQLDEAKRLAAEACDVGTKTLEKLSAQDETLREVEDSLEAHEFIIRKGLKTLRSMTWSGMLYNMWASDPEPPVHSISGENGTLTASVVPVPPAPPRDQQQQQKKELVLGASLGDTNLDADILEIEKSVQQMHSLSVSLGEQLSGQDVTLDRITEKTERVHDATLAATLKSSRIIQRYERQPGTFVGLYQFVNDWGEFLCVCDQCLIMSDTPRRSSVFEVYQRQDNLLALRNAKTLKYVGVTSLGSIKVSGEYWGKYEDCFVDLTGVPSGLLVLSRNWGGGGWLKNKPTGGHDGAPEVALLTASTSDISDKTDILLVRAKKLQESKRAALVDSSDES